MILIFFARVKCDLFTLQTVYKNMLATFLCRSWVVIFWFLVLTTTTFITLLVVMFRSCNFRSSGGLGPLPFGPWTVRSFLHRSSGFFRSFLGTINHWKSDAQGIILSNLKNHAFFLSTIFACICTPPLSLIIRWSSGCGQNKFWSQR